MNYYEDQEFDTENEFTKGPSFTEFIGCTFSGIDFSSQQIRGSRFIECIFNHCNLSNSSILNSSFRDILFKESKLVGINWSEAKGIADFKATDSILDYGVFVDLKISNSQFASCSIRNAEISNTDLQHSKFEDCDFSNTIFHRTNLENSDFRTSHNFNIDLTQNKVKGVNMNIIDAVRQIESFGIKIS